MMLSKFRLLLSGLVLTTALSLPALTATTEQYESFNNATLGELPPPDEAGSFQVEGLKPVQWEAGERPVDYFPLGLLDDLGAQDMTLSEIAGHAGLDLEKVALSELELIEWQTIGNLAQSVPQLANYRVGDVQPILETLGEEYADTLIGELDIGAANTLLSNLGGFSIRDIPNLGNTEIGKFRESHYSSVSGVPGLESVPLSEFEGYASPLIWGKMDLPLAELEANRTRAITGAFDRKRQWKTHSQCGEKCKHAELDNLTPGIDLKGREFVDMSTKVEGGWGVLAWVGGGKESTGRHPWGKSFKYVIDVDEQAEAEGRVKTWFLWRYCQREPFTGRKIGCSPYGVESAVAKTPFFPIKESGIIPLGAHGLTQAVVEDSAKGLVAGPVSSVASSPDDTSTPPSSEGGISEGPTEEEAPAAPPEENSCPSSKVAPASGYPVTSEFAARRNCPDCSRVHEGTDVGTPTGTPLKAAQSGTVEFAGLSDKQSRNGLYVAVSACDGHRYLYLHLDQTAVKAGDRIEKGTVIARSGGLPGLKRSGSSTGPHVHIHVYGPGSNVAINPRNYMPVN